MGIFGDFFDSDTDQDAVEELPEVAGARTRLFELGTQDVPNFAARDIAGLSELEQLTLSITREFMNAGTPETLRAANERALELVNQEDNFFERPEIAGLINTITSEGNQIANRLGRTLEIGGAATGSGGRDELGRSVDDTQGRIAGTLSPLLNAERQRDLDILGILQNLTSSTDAAALNRLNAGFTGGGLQRSITQAQNDAATNNINTRLSFPFTTQAPILSNVMGSDPGVIATQQLSDFEKLASVANVAAGFIPFSNPGRTGPTTTSVGGFGNSTNLAQGANSAQVQQFLQPTI